MPMCKNVLTYKQYDSYKDFLHALVTNDEEALKISSVCDYQWNYGTRCKGCPVSDFIHCPEVEKRKKVK